MKCRYSFSLVLGAILLWSSSSTQALSQKTAEIFKKTNRELGPPPRSLKATSENSRVRYSDAARRLEKKIQSDEKDLKTTPVEASASLFPQDEAADEIPLEEEDDAEIPAASARRSSRNRPRRLYKTRSTLALPRRTEGFDGRRVFGVGFLGAGAYGVFGAEIDFGVTKDWTAGFGLGTGMSYNTWGLHSRYFLQKSKWSPFVEAGYAQWHLGRVPRDGSPVLPTHLTRMLFESDSGSLSPRSAHVLYPGIGVLYQHRSGLAALFELQYFVNALNFSGGLFGTFGAYFYF